MNRTLHPYRSFAESAEAFPDALLISQIKTATKTLESLCEDKEYPNVNIKGVLWFGYEVALADFIITCCVELSDRNIKCDIEPEPIDDTNKLMSKHGLRWENIKFPDWIPRDGIKEHREYINKLKGG
jgi:hypothetical protein